MSQSLSPVARMIPEAPHEPPAAVPPPPPPLRRRRRPRARLSPGSLDLQTQGHSEGEARGGGPVDGQGGGKRGNGPRCGGPHNARLATHEIHTEIPTIQPDRPGLGGRMLSASQRRCGAPRRNGRHGRRQSATRQVRSAPSRSSTARPGGAREVRAI